jgi:cytochrome c oxidase subunit 2
MEQIHHFKVGIRGANPKDVTGATMRGMAMILPDDQTIKDVIAYIRTLDSRK